MCGKRPPVIKKYNQLNRSTTIPEATHSYPPAHVSLPSPLQTHSVLASLSTCTIPSHYPRLPCPKRTLCSPIFKSLISNHPRLTIHPFSKSPLLPVSSSLNLLHESITQKEARGEISTYRGEEVVSVLCIGLRKDRHS